MLIDRQARGWIVATVVMFVIATALYVPYARAQLHGPSGSTWQGLTYGVVGTVFMVFAMLLSARKRLRTLRIGRAFWWAHAHVWLGLLAYPLILYHAGFRWGQPFGMTWWLMLLFTVIVVSGVIGLILQNVVPTKMLRELPMETIYEQADRVVGELRNEADRIVENAADADTTQERAFERDAVPAGGAVATVTRSSALAKGRQVLKDFYSTDVRPFLDRDVPAAGRLMSLTTASAAFDQVRLALPKELHEHLTDLQSIVDERRQVARQKRMHHVLHGWLMIHVPLSFALSLLAVVHIVVALRYL
jgi:hypothetical protein